MKTYCATCKGNTNHIVINEISDSDGEPEEYWYETTHQIIKCIGCDSISFRRSVMDRYSFDDEGNPAPYETLYPAAGHDMISMKYYFRIPNRVRTIYQETIKAYNTGSYLLCTAGLRATIEGICTEEGIKDGLVTFIGKDKVTKTVRKKDLQGKIQGLHEKGLLTLKHAEILHEHRLLGNDAIHELSTPSKEELKLAIEIIEHTIDNIYEIDRKAEELKKQKQKRLKKT